MKLEATVLALAAALVAPMSAQARSEAGCAVKGSETLLANQRARVFLAPTKLRAEPSPVYAYYGCLRRTNRRVYLGGGGCGRVEDLHLTGSQVAYTRTFCNVHGEYGANVAVTSLRSGRRHRNEPAFLGPPPPSVPCDPDQPCSPGIDLGGGPERDVTALKLKANGSGTWIGRQRGPYNPTSPTQSSTYIQYEVRKSDRSGRNVLLDSGVDIYRESLRLSRDGKTIHWLKRGLPVSAPLY